MVLALIDVRAQGFWGVHHQQAYFDVRVFNPLAISNRQTTISTCFRSHDREKRRVYEQHVREVERGSFTLVSRGQTAFFRFYLWWRKKGSGLVHTRVSS